MKNDKKKVTTQAEQSELSVMSPREHIRWLLVAYDALAYLLVCFVLLYLHPSDEEAFPTRVLVLQFLIGLVAVIGARMVARVYNQVWRYGGTAAYIRLFLADTCACLLCCAIEFLRPLRYLSLLRILAISSMTLLMGIVVRIIYQYIYHFSSRRGKWGDCIRFILRVFGGMAINPDEPELMEAAERRIRIAIVGAGRTGVGLAEELLNNPRASYVPVCFIETNREKIGRDIYGVSVLSEQEASFPVLETLGVQEIVFALPQLDAEKRKELYNFYRRTGCRIKVYDYPAVQSANAGRRTMREFDVEELLFRKPIEFDSEHTAPYYRDKVILITGGGGSIGSELCRQIAKLQPKRLVVLDVYENGAYDIQQELKQRYGDALDLRVEIVSVCDRDGLEQVFAGYRPDVVLNAAAHKHVPLMEHNCCEAVKNNIFGTLNTVELAVKYKTGRFIMVSTDKAVNPTNVMGATKRMCEMIVQCYSQFSPDTVFNATRFGNVLGSAGSVIPLFRRQIAAGGPVTVTDKRIIRYFMTIPEASQLVLQSGAMAKAGELFVLDMGKPVKILELAESMIRLSGFEPYHDIKIIETGLRPGEKLYEELLVQSETLTKTANSLIFIERDTPLEREDLERRLALLRHAAYEGDDAAAKQALRETVPTFHSPEEVNAEAADAKEMREAMG